MTNKEAIKWLESIDEKYIHGGDEWYDAQRHEAINLAIKALECISQAENAIEIENTFENGRFCKTCKHYIPNADDLSERCYDCLLSNFGDKTVRENAKLWKYPNWEANNEVD